MVLIVLIYDSVYLFLLRGMLIIILLMLKKFIIVFFVNYWNKWFEVLEKFGVFYFVGIRFFVEYNG